MDGWIETGCVIAMLLSVGGVLGLADLRRFSARWLLVAAALVLMNDALLSDFDGALPHILPRGRWNWQGKALALAGTLPSSRLERIISSWKRTWNTRAV